MSITSAQIFVKAERLDRLLKVLEGYLARWAKAARPDWPDVPFLGRDASRSTQVLPPLDGWCCLLDPDPRSVDPELARELSAALATTAVGVVLRGGELAWSSFAFEKGQLAREEREPPEAFDPEAASGVGPMPVYPDATFEATRALQAEGIPLEYWLLTQDDLALDGSDADEAIWVDEVVARPEKKRPVERGLRAPMRPRHEPGRIPFRPDMERTSADVRPVLIEIRSLFGRPDHQSVANLLEIERADRNRLAEFRREPSLGDTASGGASIYFEYSVRGAPEDELVKSLDLRRPDFFRSRPPKSGFLASALGIARDEQRVWKNVRPSGFGLAFRYGESGPEQSVDLGKAYVDYMEGRLPARGPDEAIRRLLAEAAEGLARTAGQEEFKAVRDLITPLLVQADEAERLASEGVPSKPLGHGVGVVVACKVGDGTALIDSEDLERWGAEFDAALEAARDNLLRHEKAGASPPVPVDIAPGRRALAFLSGERPATRLLMPGLATILSRLLDATAIVCAVPDQMSFFAVDASDPEAAQALRAFARERLMVAETPLTADLFHAKGDEIAEA